MSVDPIAILSAIALTVALVLGGDIDGFGGTVGASISQDSITIGFTPIVIVANDDLRLIHGITVGSVIIYDRGWGSYWGKQERRYDNWVPGDLYRLDYYRRLDGRRTLHYELGHIDGWTRYGISYPIEILKHPCQWDPAMLEPLACGRADRRLVRAFGVASPPTHWLISYRYSP